MAPPLRDKKEKGILQQEREWVGVIGTDHCPFDAALKNKPYTAQIPMGVGGIQYSFAAMYQLYGSSIIPKFTLNPAKAHGLYPRKGTLLPGADADVVIFDDTVSYCIKDKETIYHQMHVKGKIETVLSRGRCIVEEGIFKGGQGAYVERRLIL